MKNIFKQISSVLIVLAIIVGVGYSARYADATLTYVQTPTITLYASISGTATSMRVTPYPKDLDGNKLTMTDFGSSPTATIDPKIRNVEEIVGFSGITDNGDGTATLTGLTRDLTSKAPYTTTGTGRAHSASAIVVFSNNPQMYARLAAPENTQVWSAIQTYSSLAKPRYDVNPTFGSSDGNAFVNYATLVATAIQGAGTSSESSLGVVQLATTAQAGAGTASSTTGAPLVLKAASATSTCQLARSSILAASSTTGKLDGRCLDTTSNAYSWAKPQTFTGTVTTNSTTTNATTTNLAVTGYATGITQRLYLNTSPASQVGGSSASTTIFSFTVPANTLSTGNYIKINIPVSAFVSDNGIGGYLMELGYGNASTTLNINSYNAAGGISIYGAGEFNAIISATGATNSQKMTLSFMETATSTLSWANPSLPTASSTAGVISASIGVDSTQAQQIVLQVRTGSGGPNRFVPDLVTAEIYR